jgi:hypothetical protein
MDSSSSLNPSWSGTLALWTFTLRRNPSMSTRMWRLRARTFLPPALRRLPEDCDVTERWKACDLT